MAKIDDILAQMKRNPKNVRFTDLCKVCENFFGEPRKGASSHRNGGDIAVGAFES